MRMQGSPPSVAKCQNHAIYMPQEFTCNFELLSAHG